MPSTQPKPTTTATKLVEIYELIDPRDGSVRYVGKANDAEKRLKSHIRDARCRNTPVYAWMRKLVRLEMIPILRIISRIPENEWEHEERKVIFEARLTHAKLLNVADGGAIPKCSLETRKTNGRNMQSHPNTIAQRKINGRNLNSGENLKKVMSREELIIYTYDRILRLFAKKGMIEKCRELAGEMMLRAEINPNVFGKWGTITFSRNGQTV